MAKPWERDWSAGGTPAAAGTKPWERQWASPVAPAEAEPTLADAETAYPMPTGAQMRRKAGVRPGDRAYWASPEGRAEAERTSAGVTRQAAKGATFGAAPRIEAAVDTGFGLAGDYSKRLDEIRDANTAYEKDSPNAAGAARLGGSLLTGGAVAPVFVGARAGLAPLIGEKLATAGATVAAGGAAGGATGALESKDWTDAPGTVVDAGKGALLGAGGAAAFGAAPYLGYQAVKNTVGPALGTVRDVFGRWTNTGGDGWAARHREKLLANHLRANGIQIDGVTPGNARQLADGAGQYVDDAFTLARSGEGRGQNTPVSYAMRAAYDRTLHHAIKTEGANHAPMQNAARGIVADQPAVTRRAVNAPPNAEAAKARLEQRAGPGMTPAYDAIGPAPIDVPALAALARADPNVRSLLGPSVRAAHTEGRLPANMVAASLRMGRRRQLTPLQTFENQLDTLAGRPLGHATTHPAQTTTSVAENMLRRAGGRIEPENSADVVTDMAAQRAIERALQQDARANPSIPQLLATRREHSQRKAAVENFERGRGIMQSQGSAQDDAVNAMLDVNTAQARIAGRDGTRASISALVSDAPEETVANVANAVVPEGRRRVLAAALGQRRGHYNHAEADTIADHMEEVGRRSAHATSIQRLIEGGQEPAQAWPETLARAAISYKMTPGLAVGRVYQNSSGLNSSRASAIMRETARPADSASQQEYADLARALVLRRMTNPAMLRALERAAAFEGQEGVR